MAKKPWGLAVRAMIGDGRGRYLMLRRHHLSRFFAECWEFPGGKVDSGESLAEALVREVQEEIGITIRVDHLLWASEFEFPMVRAVMLIMQAKRLRGKPKLSDEHEEFRWVTVREMERLPISPQIESFVKSLAPAHKNPRRTRGSVRTPAKKPTIRKGRS